MIKVLSLAFLLLTTSCATKQIRVAEKSIRQTVHIVNVVQLENRIGTYTGSGVVISKFGHILTCAHLMMNDTKVVTITLRDGTIMAGEVIFVDHNVDLSLVKINLYTPGHARIAGPFSLRAGQDVITVGHPAGYDWTVTKGVVSSTDFRTRVQIDAALNPGNSGGPLFDMEGRVVGINVSLYSPILPLIHTGIGFAVSPKSINQFLSKFRGL